MAVAAVVLLYVPAGHCVQLLADVAPDMLLYVPSGHDRHKFDVFAAEIGLYVPGLQSVQSSIAEAPVSPFQLPSGHGYAVPSTPEQ